MKRWVLPSCVVLLCVVLFQKQLHAEDSNRNEVRANLEKDGWTVVWGKNFTEGDWAQGTASIAESVATESPAPFLKWFEQVMEENLAKIERNLQGVGRAQIEKWIVQSLKQKSIVTYKNFQIEVGFATYNRWERIVYDEPRTGQRRLRVFGGWTYVPYAYTERVERKVPLPNWHQFYVRYKLDDPQVRPGGNLVTNRSTTAEWERFTFENHGDRVALKFHTGYLCAEGGGGGAVKANRATANGWEMWKLIKHSDGSVSLQASNGNYFCAESGGSSPPVANRPTVAGWEKWQLADLGSGFFALKACNNKFLCSVP